MQHIYQRHVHRIIEFRNHSCFLEYDEVVCLNQYIKAYLSLHGRELYVRVDDELRKCKVQKHMQRLRMIILVLLQCIVDLKFDLS